jgi:[protein-PII] uridylyltransferase
VNPIPTQNTESSAGDLKALLAEEDAVIRQAHFGGAPGGEVVQRRTALIDRVLRAAHGRIAASGPLPALLAIGGYGRGDLNPHSDIDIMFVCRDESDRERSRDLLYVLWDAGLDIGYSVRTVKECVSLARQDIKIRTSMIESRLIAGSRDLYDSFLASMRSDVFYWKPSAFIAEKLSERNATRQKFGGSIYLREPNIKEGAGGLRDIHTSLWIAAVHFRISSLSELVEKGVITEGEYAVFLRARNFLWTVRNEIHYLSGRKNDHLTFDLQEQTARDFRYRDSTHLLAVERFMKAYFIHARTIREFSNRIAAAVLQRPSRRWFERTRKFGQFSMTGGTLFLPSGDDCSGDAAQVLAAFQLSQQHHARFSDRLQSGIRSCRIDPESRSSRSAAETFLAILDSPDHLADTLLQMKELRFLGRYLPEFRAIQALTRQDYYHLYAVDEHILLAIRNLEQLWTGTYPAQATLRDAFMSLPKRWPLILAVLLHDLGKAFREDHEVHGVEIAGQVLDRIGVQEPERARILFLVEHHLVMSNLSQRRELSDRKVIDGFARLVGDRENLAMLYLLTYADIAAVNPGAWTQWKAVLLQDLYLKTLNYFEVSSQAADEAQARLVAASTRIRSAAQGSFTPEQIDAFLVSMPDEYVLYTPSAKAVDHLGMVRRLPDEKLVIQYQHYPERGFTELTVCAYDAYGMFYRTAGTIASKNLNILRAKVHTSRTGVMIDTFQITDPEGNLCAYNDAWESVCADLKSALMNQKAQPEPGVYGAARPVSGLIQPSVEFDNETSDAFTIIDLTARDRVGILYRITKILFDLNLDIGSAKIVTEGARILDSFYVTDLFREKVVDADRLGKIRERLLKVLG